MGGVCLQEHALPDVAAQLPGPPSSLRAEAAAMLELLLTLPPTIQLTVLSDSLSLLRLLNNYHRRGFRFQPLQHQELDLLERILDALRERTAETLLVKVKSHTGIELNAEADRLAKQGLAAAMIAACPRPGYLPFHIGGQTSLHMQLREVKGRWHSHRARWQEDRLVNGASTVTV
eukprot:3336116-Rhodomonas_salina.1